MFAVKGWKLGPIVTQTLPSKKKLKRKRGEKEIVTGLSDTTTQIRENPFSLQTRKTSQPKSHLAERKRKPAKSGKFAEGYSGDVEESESPFRKGKRRKDEKANKNFETKVQHGTHDIEPGQPPAS